MSSAPEASKSPPPVWHRWGREARFVWAGGWQRLWPRLWIVLVAVVVGAGLVLLFSPQDNALLGKIRMPDNQTATSVAKELTYWGDLKLSIPLSLIFWLSGAAGGKVRWRKLGLALLMASLVSGLIVNVFRMSMGRPRPYYQERHPELTDTFHGPQLGVGGMQSFPSGHACASAVTGTMVAAGSPVMVIPGAVIAMSVSWSRLQLNSHHPLDIAVGASIGILCSLCYASTVPGVWIRLRRKRKRAGVH